jgi:uncharacterized membrane protein YhaH (DUF805 family)
MTFDSMFANPSGRTSRGQFIPAVVTLLAAVAFYQFLVTGLTAKWCTLVLVFPAFVLHARRLHDMGRSAWLLLIPTAVLLAAFSIWLGLHSMGAQLDAVVPTAALVLAAAFALWGCLGSGQATSNRFGAP